MKQFFTEFKAFAMRGNVVDLAVGIIIGAAFGKIVSSMVENIFMPPIGVALGGVDFKDLAITLKEAEGAAPAVLMKYGMFIQSLIDFTIIALAIFLVVKGMTALKKKEEAAPSAPPPVSDEVRLLSEIRDLLRKN